MLLSLTFPSDRASLHRVDPPSPSFRRGRSPDLPGPGTPSLSPNRKGKKNLHQGTLFVQIHCRCFFLFALFLNLVCAVTWLILNILEQAHTTHSLRDRHTHFWHFCFYRRPKFRNIVTLGEWRPGAPKCVTSLKRLSGDRASVSLSATRGSRLAMPFVTRSCVI